jgi:hypothetical protein
MNGDNHDGGVGYGYAATASATLPKAKQRKGRSARRREQKMSERRRHDDRGSEEDPRCRSWPAALQRRKENQFEPRDEVALIGQLGYLPGNVIGVSARIKDLAVPLQKVAIDDQANEPVVVQLYPIAVRAETKTATTAGRERKRKRHPADDQEQDMVTEPFPTLYWITHPQIRALISDLEKRGRGTEYERRLAADPVVRRKMETAHKEYATERWQHVLTDQDRAWLVQRQWHSYLGCCGASGEVQQQQNGRGIAGSRHFASVKCLHAHAAHYWSGNTNNIFGQWVAEELCDLMR